MECISNLTIGEHITVFLSKLTELLNDIFNRRCCRFFLFGRLLRCFFLSGSFLLRWLLCFYIFCRFLYFRLIIFLYRSFFCCFLLSSLPGLFRFCRIICLCGLCSRFSCLYFIIRFRWFCCFRFCLSFLCRRLFCGLFYFSLFFRCFRSFFFLCRHALTPPLFISISYRFLTQFTNHPFLFLLTRFPEELQEMTNHSHAQGHPPLNGAPQNAAVVLFFSIP